jgi:hypothetical protein
MQKIIKNIEKFRILNILEFNIEFRFSAGLKKYRRLPRSLTGISEFQGTELLTAPQA